ncbi:MAG: DNA polymerase III subunit beta [Verrucomicrobiales bacterium]|nr:DNA polymerase III subunit beta [Verrucomicrobiales bacterium]
MKFLIDRDAFLEALQQVQHVVSSRTTLPILSNVLIEADGDTLKLTTTDLDVGISGQVKAQIERGGATTLPARKLVMIIRELNSGEVSVDVDSDNVASVRNGPSFFKIIGLDQEEFPPLASFDEAREFVIEQAKLKDALRKTAYAISTDETRYVLNGIYWSFKDNVLTLVATDGRRLAMVEQDVEFPKSNEINVIIPTKAINELQRLLGDEGEVRVRISDSQVSFELNDSILVSKLIEGNYPNFRQVIPGEAKQRITLEREVLFNAVKRVAILTSDKSNSIKLSFKPDMLQISANSPEIGEAHESLHINYKGPVLSIAFNPEFLMAPLRNLAQDEVFLDLIDEMSPGVLKIDEPFIYVLMPMRVTN